MDPKSGQHSPEVPIRDRVSTRPSFGPPKIIRVLLNTCVVQVSLFYVMISINGLSCLHRGAVKINHIVPLL